MNARNRTKSPRDLEELWNRLDDISIQLGRIEVAVTADHGLVGKYIESFECEGKKYLEYTYTNNVLQKRHLLEPGITLLEMGWSMIITNRGGVYHIEMIDEGRDIRKLFLLSDCKNVVIKQIYNKK